MENLRSGSINSTTGEGDDDNEDENDEFSAPFNMNFKKCISMIGKSFTKTSLDEIYQEQNGSRQRNTSSFCAYDIVSLSESKIDKLLKAQEKQLICYHKRFLSRIYPKGSRVSSSNYDPLPAFAVGS